MQDSMEAREIGGQPPAAGGLYLHVPFCRTICPYCDFAVVADRGKHDDYLRATARALVEDPPAFALTTVYIGGGTPSRLSPVELSALTDALPSPSGGGWSEFTLEVNPEDVDDAALEAWRGLGVDRLSVGVQRLDRDGLRRLGRARSADAVDELPGWLERWRRLGGTASIDLIYGLPGDGPDGIVAQARALAAWPIDHMSAYALTVEPGTPFARAEARGMRVAASGDGVAGMYESLVDAVVGMGWDPYEVSNFCRAGRRARHNSGYWQGLPYAGYGLGAASLAPGDGEWRRFTRCDDWREYLAFPARRCGEERVDDKVRRAERLLTGLRCFVGVPESWLDAWLDVDPHTPARLLDEGVLVRGRGACAVPPRHRMLAEEIAGRWLAAWEKAAGG